MTDGLVVWLRAQLDEDARLLDEYEAYMAERSATAGSFVLVTPPGWQLGEPFDPDRQRAEVDAKRRILDLVASTELDPLDESDRAHRTDLDAVLRLLALSYADRPGYRPEWAPAAG